MHDIRTILFDWGNTLVCVRREDRAWRNCTTAAVTALTERGVHLPPDAARTLQHRVARARERMLADPDHGELNLQHLLQIWLSDATALTPADGPGMAAAAAHAFWQAWTTCLDLLDQADQVLAGLSERGFQLGLVSNVSAPEPYCRTQLQRLNLLPHLDTVTLSSTLGVRKPASAIYQRALDQVHSHRRGGADLKPEQLLFVGDSPQCDIAGPQRFGWRTALIKHPEVDAPWPAVDYATIQPTCCIQRLQELETLLPARPPGDPQ